jgi:hypothetical protein
LKDPRLRAFAAAELKALAFNISDAPFGADLIVVDTVPTAIPSGSRVLVVEDSAAPLPPECERSGAAPSEIRRALRRLVGTAADVQQPQLTGADT